MYWLLTPKQDDVELRQIAGIGIEITTSLKQQEIAETGINVLVRKFSTRSCGTAVNRWDWYENYSR